MRVITLASRGFCGFGNNKAHIGQAANNKSQLPNAVNSSNNKN
jgi:hypothetical protein